MPAPISPEAFERFVQERNYLYNVSPNTELLYRAARRTWEKFGPDPVGFVAGMRKGGASATGCNIHIRSLNAVIRRAGHPPIRKLKGEEVIPPTFSPADVHKLGRY